MSPYGFIQMSAVTRTFMKLYLMILILEINLKVPYT